MVTQHVISSFVTLLNGSLNTILHLRYKALQFMLSNSYVAERYSSSDHSSPFDPLSSYSTWNSAFGVDIPWSASRDVYSDKFLER